MDFDFAAEAKKMDHLIQDRFHKRSGEGGKETTSPFLEEWMNLSEPQRELTAQQMKKSYGYSVQNDTDGTFKGLEYATSFWRNDQFLFLRVTPQSVMDDHGYEVGEAGEQRAEDDISVEAVAIRKKN